MAIHTAPQVTALQAQATANLFLSDHLSDRFTADQPQLIAADNVWRVPIILVYPGIGSIGIIRPICYTPCTTLPRASVSQLAPRPFLLPTSLKPTDQ